MSIFPDAKPVEPRTIDSFIAEFVTEVKASAPQIGHIIVVYNNIEAGNTVGIGNIAGIKDMNRCVQILESYLETLKAGIPKLH